MTDQIQNTQTAPKKPYAVAVVFSRWPLGDICAFLEDELNAQREQIGVMRIDRYKDKETNRTIVLLERSLLTLAEEKGFTRPQRGLDFKVTEYELRPHNHPKEGFSRNFYIPLPEEIPAEEARAQLQNKIDVLVNFGMFGKDEAPRLKIPLKSRETGGHRGQSFITFARETSDEVVALARILLTDTRLYTNEHDYKLMRCFWAKHKEPRQNKPAQKGGKKAPSKKGQGKKAPPKKNLVKSGPKTETKNPEKKVAPLAPIKPLAPGENQWNKPLLDSEPAPAETTLPTVTPVAVPEAVTPAPEVAIPSVPAPIELPALGTTTN